MNEKGADSLTQTPTLFHTRVLLGPFTKRKKKREKDEKKEKMMSI
jgi:hypothetical protein